MKSSCPSSIELATLAYCIWQASDLPVSWLSAPAVKYAWIAFIIWCLPAFWYFGSCILKERTKRFQPWLLGAAILVSLMGTLGSLNMFEHIGLGLAIAGTVPFTLGIPIWLATILAWLPGFGWMLKGLPFAMIPAIQILMALLGAFSMSYTLRRSCDEKK